MLKLQTYNRVCFTWIKGYKVTFFSKMNWYNEGFNLLVEVGATGLTVDTLTRRLKITKGSFYHHFKNYQDYKNGLLAYFEELTTSRTIEMLETMAKPADKIEGLLNITRSGSSQIEVALRAWALQDQEVRAFQARMDSRRLDYLQDLFTELGYQLEQAQLMGQMFYTLYVGSTLIVPELSKDRLYTELTRLYNQSKP